MDEPPEDGTSSAATVSAAFKFLKYNEVYEREKLYTLEYDDESGLKRTNIELDERQDVPVEDIRRMRHLTWDESGIAVATMCSNAAAYSVDNTQSLKSTLYPEIERVLSAMFSPSRVVIMEHVV